MAECKVNHWQGNHVAARWRFMACFMFVKCSTRELGFVWKSFVALLLLLRLSSSSSASSQNLKRCKTRISLSRIRKKESFWKMRLVLNKGHERPLTFLRYNMLFSCAKDHTPTLWYADNGERLGTYTVVTTAPFGAVMSHVSLAIVAIFFLLPLDWFF